MLTDTDHRSGRRSAALSRTDRSFARPAAGALLARRRICRVLAATVVAVALAGVSSSVASAAPGPWWHLSSNVRPASLPAGGEGQLILRATNVGDASAPGPITVSDVLPAGLTVVEEGGKPKVSWFAFSRSVEGEDFGPQANEKGYCDAQGSPLRVTCRTRAPELEFGFPLELGKVDVGIPGLGPFEVVPYEYLEMRITVKDSGVTPGASSQGEVSGGGAPLVSVPRPVPVGGPPAFGTEEFSLVPEEEGGGVDAQAGSHPFQLTASFGLNQTNDPAGPPALPRDLHFRLPAGLVGNATTQPQCDDLDFAAVTNGTINKCPADTAIGVAMITFDEPLHLELRTYPVPLFNLTPERGEPARFGFVVAQAPVALTTKVRTGSDYAVTVSTENITQLTNFISSTVTFWGVPGDKAHDSARGWGCLASGHWAAGAGQAATGLTCDPSTVSSPAPFLTLPTSCELPFQTSVEGDAWPTQADPAGAPLTGSTSYGLEDELGRSLGVTGCNQLPFDPSIEVAPDVQEGSTPTGLKVDVRVPQEVSQNGGGLASASVKDITVTLPEGVTVSPAGANGLQACSEAQAGFLSIAKDETDLFTSDAVSCPSASKLASVRIKVPLITNPLEGSVYLAEQDNNPFHSLVALYLVAEDPVSGIRVKLAGEGSLNPVTGQITTRFKNSPQAPLEEAEFHFFGGDRAPLATPAKCGAYTTDASFSPWSGTEAVTSESTFEVTSGPHGGPCLTTLPFAPALNAGTSDIQAGAFTPLTTNISREDGNQDIQTVQLHFPPGVSGILTGVPLCPESQANAGTCPQSSLIGHTVVSVGLGGDPYSVTGGQVFLTEKYAGAPFGLSIVNPAVAGPFNLGNVVVRAKLEIDKTTAAITVTTGTIPHILDGIPLQIKNVNVTIDRPNFTFNPTNCNRSVITGNIESGQALTSPVSIPFEVANCAALKFAPKFAVTTSGKTSRSKGASLTARLSYPNAPQGTQANITRVKVDLPKQLPSRLTTLQKACTNAQFETNPANCPAASKIGIATVTTPLLPVPLEGPAIFVSHGGEAFPSLTMVLQGYGVTVDLVGTTFISKAGITSTTFKTVPDVPFNTFQLTLPQGKFSALAANGNLCKAKLTMPTEFLAQNGLVVKQNTAISVTGCPKAKKTTKKKDKRKAKKGKKKG
jgi:uncharacterized repeat protein (TIGR01451 family)